MTSKFLNLGRNLNSNSWNLQVTKQTQFKEILSKIHYNKIVADQDKEGILKATKENKFITYKGTPIKVQTDSSAETWQPRWEWGDLFQVLKGK